MPVHDEEAWISQLIINDLRRLADEIKELRRELAEQKTQQELQKFKIHAAVVVVSFFVSVGVAFGKEFFRYLLTN